MKLYQHILQSIYPNLCRSCHQLIVQDDIFCIECVALLRPVPSIELFITKKYSLKVYAAAAYTDPVKLLITKKFYGDIRASKQLAHLILSLTPLQALSVDYFVPVPLHWTRYAYRGFNQAHEMSTELSKLILIPTASVVIRSRITTYQSRVAGKDRMNNVHNAFDLAWRYRYKGIDWIRDKHIVIVDDLCTTGATLVSVAKMIISAKPASISAVVGCRAI